MITNLSEDEKRLIEANKKLVDKNNELTRDLLALISYIEGKSEKEYISGILKYYKQQITKTGYKGLRH